MLKGKVSSSSGTCPTMRCRSDAGTDNVYDVTVKVTDNGSPKL